ncbi:MAG: hypothetical protein JRJ38_04715 [Deltaproteobacteria bacterium]|nr:hypothetical protein [Deltaproteobacteria bacterium]
MFYRLKMSGLKSRILKAALQKLSRLTAFKFRGNGVPDSLKADLIRKYVPNRSFADIGCMWRVNGYFSFLAEKCGANSVAAVDIYPPSNEFKDMRRKQNSKVAFIQGDIHSKDTVEKIGLRDVIFCSGLLYHSPNPVYTLGRLRSICSDILIINTSTIPEIPSIQNAAVFYPFLRENQRKIWRAGIGQLGISTPYDVSQGYGNWFWGFSRTCLESMLQCAGFQVKERYGDAFITCFVCHISSENFLPVSGDWTAPPRK